MCGRYDNLIPRDAYRGLFATKRLPDWNFPPRYNIAPTDQIPIVRVDPRDDTRELALGRWGLIPFWMKEKPNVPHINARAETVHKTRLLRCLIPAPGFYEWEKRADGRPPYRFAMKDREPFAFAGLWKLSSRQRSSWANQTGSWSPSTIECPSSHTAADEARVMLKPYDEKLMTVLCGQPRRQ